MKNDGKKTGRVIGRILLWFIAVWAVLLIAVQVLLSPSVLTGVVNNVASEFIDGDVSFGKVSTSVLKNFPNLNVTLHDFTLTYPDDRFEDQGNAVLKRFGRGADSDTLASFKEFSASVNLAALAFGRINIPSVTLHRPRIFAKQYNDTTYNWNVIKGLGTTEEADTLSSGVPDITVEKVILDGRPMIVYCNNADTLYAFMNLKEMKFTGRLSTSEIRHSRISFMMDSLFVSGRMARDTIALGLDRLRIREHEHHVDLEVSTKAFLATKSYGRLSIPVNINSHIAFPNDSVPAISFSETAVDVAGIPMRAEADLKLTKDGLYMKGTAGIEECKVSEVLRSVGKLFYKGAGDIKTDAVISMSAGFDGYYSPSDNRLPAFNASITIPDAFLSHKKIGLDWNMAFDATAVSGQDGYMSANLGRFRFKGPAIDVRLAGIAEDLLGEDPLFEIRGHFGASLDTIGRHVAPKTGYTMSGSIEAEVAGLIKMSQIDPYKFAGADLKGYIKSPHLVLNSAKDSLAVYMDSLDIRLGTMSNTADANVRQGERMLAFAAYIDSTDINYKDNIFLKGNKLSFKAHNSAEILSKTASAGRVYPFGGRLDIGYISLKDNASTSLSLRNSANTFSMYSSGNIPALKLVSDNGGIFLRHPSGRLLLRELDMDAKARLTGPERRRRAKAFADSLAKAHPDVPRDSLFNFIRKRPSKARQVPEWLTEDDFRKKDLNFKLDETIARYLREWDAEGNLSIGRASLMTPRFPLRTSISDFDGHVTNNEIRINSLKFRSGSSGMSADGRLSGLKMALQGRGRLRLDLNASADSLHVNELLGAFVKGVEYAEKFAGEENVALDDEAFEDMITADTLASVPLNESSLLVVPANIEANIALRASDVTYSTVKLDKASADIRMMQRCIQITNTIATSNIGNLGFEGFYSTQTKKDLKTGFRLKMDDITADKVIEMVPAVDSIMPVLKTFRGNLNCEIAATADLDTNMNIVMPSLDGVIRVGGKNLELSDNPAIDKVARILKFKDRSGLKIDRMSVEGQIRDSKIEIFPFILNVDRYMLGMSGIQNLDQTFRYHISIIKSPLVIRFGVDLFGDFDDFKFRIGKAKYKGNDVPVFSAVVDQVSINLSNSIRNIFRKGVDEVMRENRRQEAIEKYKEKTDYRNAVDIQLDSLSDAEKARIEE